MQTQKLALTVTVLAAFAPAYAQQTLPEVVITASKAGQTERAGVAGFTDMPLLLTPAAVTVIGREQMQELGIRNLTGATKLDASVSDSYNAVGYAEQFSIRGFNLDNNSSYRKDGMAIPADTQIPLENKERIEILKGLSGLQAGVSAPGGVVNFVLKRPTASTQRSFVAEVSERGTLYAAADFGGRFEDKRFGYRINAAVENIKSYVRGADGDRQFLSGAFDFQISPQALLQVDADFQHKAQITVPGYQLLNGVSLPKVSPDVLLNNQPWARPVDTTSGNLGLKFEYLFDANWRASVSANQHWFKRNDYTAFPYGCRADNLYPGYCANGDYDVYDYQSEGERKSPFGMQALVNGKVGAHELAFGLSYFKRRDEFGNYVYDYAGTSNIYHNVIVSPAPGMPHTGPVSVRRTENESALFVQDIVSLAPNWKLHAGLRMVQAKKNVEGVASNDNFVLPNVALVFNPSADWTLYGSIARGMEHGGIAPMGTTNENQALAPSLSKQTELGVKAAIGDLSLAAAVFEISKGLEFTRGKLFMRAGDEVHRGLEFSANGKLGALNYGATATWLQTEQSGTGQADTDGKRITDVPSLKTAVYADYALGGGFKLNGVWQYVGKKAFDLMNTVFVPDYSTVNIGASYTSRSMTVRAFIDNAFDKFYWRDVTPQLGGYLITGPSRTFKVSAQFDF